MRAARRFLERRGLLHGGLVKQIPALRQMLDAKQIRRFAREDKSGVAEPAGTETVPLGVGGAVWTAAGPLGVNSLNFGVVTGRVSSLALDPSDATGNRLFVGTTGGGVWKSQNAAAGAGVQFVPLTDGIGALKNAPLAGISVGAVSVQPGGTGVVLAGLGDPNDALDSYYGGGLLRSTDNGSTWALISQTVDLEGGQDRRDYSFLGEGFAGFAWSTTNVQVVVAAVSQAYEGTLVNAGQTGFSYQGLYYSTDGGANWHLARIEDPSGADVQGPGDVFTSPDGNAATAVVWNPVRQVFLAAVRFHGYYQSADGVTWMRLPISPNGQPGAQPGTGLTVKNCPTQAGNVGVVGCPIFRGALAVNPQTGDTFAWTVDANNQDQGIWRDQCGLSGNSCTNASITFGTRLDSSALESPGLGGDTLIANGDYNLTLAAVPGGLGTGQDTLLFAGANDLWKCSLANSCVWRNTTNATTCTSARVGEYQHALAWDSGNPLVMYVGNDSGLWRSTDQVGETGSVCGSGDAGHFTNLNASLGANGSLAEVESLGQSRATAGTMLVGLGANGFAGVVNAPVLGVAGNWNEVLGGEGGTVAVDGTSLLNNWYANAAAGVGIYHCSSVPGQAVCTPAGFGASTGPVVGEAQVENDGLSMGYPAEFLVDAVDASQLLIGTCRVWRGPANGSGWSGSNAISPVLDGTGGSVCNGNALIRSLAAGPITSGGGAGGEMIYVGMAGNDDGGGVVAGHLFSATVGANGVAGSWRDLTFSPVTNSALALNASGLDVSSVYADPHDATGGTVYVTLAGFSSGDAPLKQAYLSTDGGLHWTSITANLPNAPVNAVVVDPQDPNTVYLGTDAGVYVTRALASCGSGSCWATYGTGLPLSPVTSLAATPSGAANAVLTAGTYGRGVWQTVLATAGATVTAATVTPGSLAFGSRTVGTPSAAQAVTVKVTGTAALVVSAVGVTGTGAGDFSETDTCVGTGVAKGAACVVKVAFTPTSTGARAGTLVISGNVAGGQLLVPLTGAGVATGSVTLQPAGVSFGTVQVGVAAAAQVVSVQNVGGSAVTLSSVTVGAPFVRVANTCGSSLAVGAACAVTVGFTPTQAGAATGSVTVVDSVGTQVAALSGTGITGPTDTLSTTSLVFPATVEGLNSALVVQVTNSGGLPLASIGTSISAAAGSVGGDFAAVSNCGGTLAAGASCGVVVTFAPTVARLETATMAISDAVRVQNVVLSGKGLAPPVITVATKAISFGSQQINVAGAAKTLTIQNTGGSPLGTLAFSLTGAGSASFQVGANTCGTSVAASGTCTVQLVFDPVTVGTSTGTLTVGTSSLGVASAAVALSGTGLSPPMLGVSPAALNLGPVVVGNASGLFTVQVTNVGQLAMNGPVFAVSGANAANFALSAPLDIAACAGTPGSVLAPGATCNEQVSFSPTALGVATATLTVTGPNAIPATATVSLAGTGTALILLQASPAQVQFPATTVGVPAATQVVTISNLGRQKANGLVLAVTGPYRLVPGSTTCGTVLTAASSCTVGVSFTPVLSGDQPGSLTATVTNLGVSLLTVGLDGSGVSVGGILPSPTQMTFGSVVVQASSVAQMLTVTNSGQAALVGSGIAVTGDFGLTGNGCSGVLGAGESCTVGVVFSPAVSGSRAGTLTVSTTSTGVAPAVVGLTGNGIPAGTLIAVPAVVSFGTVTVGQASPAQTVTLTNAGATTLLGLQYQLAGDYSLPQSGCGGQLASGGSCSFTVSFSPGVPGTRIGSVTVQSTNAGFVPLLVGLTGTGLPAAQLVVTNPMAGAVLAFGPVLVGSNSVALQLTVANPGTGALSGLFFTATTPFSVGSGSCGGLLLPGGTCGVPVTFTPVAGGAQTGVVTVSSTSLGVGSVPVPVTGTGIQPASLAISPATVAFGGVTVGTTSAAQGVTVTNPGGGEVAGLTLGVSGDGASSGDFAMSSTSCAGTLAAGASCSVVVSFAPKVAGGRQGFLTAASTTKGVSSVAANLTGTGLTPAVLSMTPGQLTFAATVVGQLSAVQTVEVLNTGQSGIGDLVVGVTAGFQLDSGTTTCTAQLGAGANCVLGVHFAPGLAGALTGALTASSVEAAAGGTAPVTAALSGTGALPPGIVTVPGGLVQFQTTGVGQAAQAVTVTVTNSGTLSALTGLAVVLDGTGAGNGFGLQANTCGTSAAPVALGAGMSCTVDVTFKPAKAGQGTGSLIVASANGANTVSLSLGGIGFDFVLTGVGSSSATVVRGQTAYYTLAVTSLGGSTVGGVFSFGCASVPSNALCIFNPPVLGPLRGTGNVSLGVSTAAPTVASNDGSNLRGRILLVCVVMTLPLGWWRRRSAVWSGGKIVRWLCVLGLVIAGLGGVTSCAGSGGSGSQLHLGGGTPTGTYSIAVTASSLGVTHSYVVKLVVN